ncbi:ribonuclease HII, partial [Enterobacter hormaechei subsp. steigerwaltii]|nr:ribonuclease HII [Enterobacter hormaechei subsp. steigerwaltii]
MHILTAGVDEAGRGPLVGSVFAAAVILPETFDLPGLTDSKKLSEKKRDALAEMIKNQAVAWHASAATPEEIASPNILHATMLAMKRAVDGLAVRPEKIF